MHVLKVKRLVILSLLLCAGTHAYSQLNVNKQLNYCVQQATKTVQGLADHVYMPRSIAHGSKVWRMVDYHDWTCGFWPGILWYCYEYTRDSSWQQQARRFSQSLFPLVDSAAVDHDMGFQLYTSVGNGYRLAPNETYKQVLLRAADTVSKLYNPKVGTMLSWPRAVKGADWPLRHNTIMDNMINLELLFWAYRHTGNNKYYQVAFNHATTTMHNHFRPDYTSYHVVLYDTASGKKVKGITHQGYSDSSMWARGQSWAMYGFAMVYRETKDTRFLQFAEKVTEVYLQQLPENLVPYWDFNDPAIPQAPRDASAACVAASALLELSVQEPDKVKALYYKQKAVKMLTTLSARSYQSRNENNAFLLHATGHKPAGGEIDASIIYADYYYMEALLRLKKINEGNSIYE